MLRRLVPAVLTAILLAGPGVAAAAPGTAAFELGGPEPHANSAPSGFEVIAALPGGGAVLAGNAGAGRIRLQAVRADGSADPAFGAGGGVDVDVPDDNGDTPEISELLRRPDGRLLVVFQSAAPMAFRRYTTLLGLTAAGVPDPAFAGGRPLLTDASAFGVTLDSAGRVLLGGGTGTYPANVWTVERLALDGSPDPSFGTGGTATLPDQAASGGAVIENADGTVSAEGYVENQTVLRRLNPDGAVDPGFLGGGFLPLGSPASGMLSRPDGSVDVLANPDGRLRVARVRRDGSLDPAFGSGGSVVVEGLPHLLAGPGGEDVLLGAVNGAEPLSRPVYRLERLDAAGQGLVDVTGALTPHPPGVRLPGAGEEGAGEIRGGVVRADGSVLLAGAVAVLRYEDQYDYAVEHDRGLVAAVRPDGTLDPAFGVPAAPARFTLRVAGTSLARVRGDHRASAGLRLKVDAADIGVLSVVARARGRVVARGGLAVLGSGPQALTLPVDVPRLRAARRGAVHITLTATFRGLLAPGVHGSASASLR